MREGFRLHHPLRVHVPAAALWLMTAAVLFFTGPLPARVPVHFRVTGEPDRWGSPWEVRFVILGAGLLMIVLSLVLDELFARHEVDTQTNWMSLLDEAVLANFLIAAVACVQAAQGRTFAYFQAPRWTFWAGGLALAAAFVLELWRAPSPAPPPLAEAVPEELTAEVAARQAAGQAWTYWSEQRPFYARWLLPQLGAGLLVLAITQRGTPHVARLLVGVGAVVVLAMAGGFRAVVSRGGLVVRMGPLGLPVLRLRLADIVDAHVHTFSPIGDFGGWGIRRRNGVTAYFLEGNMGVLLRTSRDKKYLIGTDHPERLAAVLNAARGASGPRLADASALR